MSASADPLRNTLDHLALDPSSKEDRRYLISMLRRLGYSEKEIDVALGRREAVEIEYKKSSATDFTVVEREAQPVEDWDDVDEGVAFSVTRGSVAKAGGDPAVEFGWRPVETQQEIHLPVEVDEPWLTDEEVHEGTVDFVERDAEWVEAADEDVEEGDEVEWVDAGELELEEGDEVEWEDAEATDDETADADWDNAEAEWEDADEWDDAEEWDEEAETVPAVPDAEVAAVKLKEENAPYAPPPKMGGGGGGVEEVPQDYIVSEPPGRVWDKEDEEDEEAADEWGGDAEAQWDSDDSETWDKDDTTPESWEASTDDAWDEDWDATTTTDTTSETDTEVWDDESWDGDATWDDGAFQYEDFTLYTRIVELSDGKEQRIYFFSKDTPQQGDPAALPDGYVVDVNERTGLPYLRRDGNPVRDLVEDQERLRCMAMTQSGSRCKRLAAEDSDFCSVHADFTADEQEVEVEHCHAIKADGDQCKRYPREGSKYCSSHKGWRGPKIDA